jgi:hypothetical protein
MTGTSRLLTERAIEGGIASEGYSPGRTNRSVRFNAAESPLGWLFSRGHVSQRQYDAG